MRSPPYAAAKLTFSSRQCSARSSTDSTVAARLGWVVVEQAAVDPERLLVDGAPAERSCARRSGPVRTPPSGGGCRVDRAAHAEDRAAVHGVERVGAGVEVRRVAPRTAERVAAVDLLVPHPLADVAGHVVVAVGGEARLLADRPRPLAAEVAEREDLREAREVGRAVPVVQRRQALAGELRVRRGLVPAHARHRVVGAALREAAELPGGRPGPARAGPGRAPSRRRTRASSRARTNGCFHSSRRR